jgi:hypothetical protein
MIYGVYSLGTSIFGDFFLLSVKDLKIVEATKSERLEGVNHPAPFPYLTDCEGFGPFLKISYTIVVSLTTTPPEISNTVKVCSQIHPLGAHGQI